MLTPDAQYAANLAALAQQPALHPLLTQMAALPLTNLQLFPSPSGALLGCAWDVHTQAWVPVCDMQDPAGAAEAAADQMWSPQHTVYTMMGLGLGYAVAALTKRLLPYQRLVVWDVDAGLFKAMLHALDVQDMFTGKRVEIYVGPDLLQQVEPWHMRLEVHEKLHMALPISHGYTKIYRKEEYAQLLTKTMDLLRFHMVGLATWRQFGRCIGDNDLENMPEYFLHPGFSAMRNLWQGKPAVCVAAGPSLRHNLRHLLPAQQRRKVALLTVGTTYALLQGMGLEPDIVTTIDFQRLNWTDQFQHIPLDPDCSLVYLHSTYPQTVRRWPGPRFVAENASDTLGWIKQWTLEDKGQAGMVQTVAHLNLLVALMLGANPIILLGQDLSMPPHGHHAPGARAQDLAPGEVPPDSFLTVTDIHGQPVQTRHSFQSMLLVFERIIADHPGTTFINASEQGLNISGTHNRPLAAVLAALPDPQAGDTYTRPVFQGETPTQLAQRTPSLLRAALRDTYTHHVPQTKEGLVEGMETVRQQVEEIATWTDEITQQWKRFRLKPLGNDERRAAQSSDCVTDFETREQLRLQAYETIIQSEQFLAARPHAVGMFVIRRFDFLELRSEIPPSAETIREPWQQAKYAAYRLIRVAAMFAEEVATVRALLRRVQRRLVPARHLRRAMAQQHYDAARRQLQAMEPGDMPGIGADLKKISGTLYRQTQQYQTALALGISEAHACRIRAHLARYYADVRHALPAYLETLAESTPNMSYDVGDTTHDWHIAPQWSSATLPIQPPHQYQTPLAVNGHSRETYGLDAAGYLQLEPPKEEQDGTGIF